MCKPEGRHNLLNLSRLTSEHFFELYVQTDLAVSYKSFDEQIMKVNPDNFDNRTD